MSNSFSEVIQIRNALSMQQRALYVAAVTNINVRNRELLQNNFGVTLVKNCARDMAGEVARRYFDFGNYYITVDQLYDRFVHFSYENDNDLLSADEGLRKAFYNINDASTSRELQHIADQVYSAQEKLFTESRTTDKLDQQGKQAYRDMQRAANGGTLYDELTGNPDKLGTYMRNGKEVAQSELHADHIQARESAKYNSRYIKANQAERLREFYNSADNMQLMHASANTSKGDIRVCIVDGKEQYVNARDSSYDASTDITATATADQLVNATVHQWEKETPSGNKTQKLTEKGYLDDQGKVKESVKEQLRRNIIHSQNAESIAMLQAMDYRAVGSDAATMTVQSMPKILAGQVFYYVLPPLLYEVRLALRHEDISFDSLIDRIKNAGNRIIHYVRQKAKNIFHNVVFNSLHKFLKSFFDILIELLKATVKRIARMAKHVVISLVNCIRTITAPDMTAAQKADAVTKTLSVTIGGIVLELIFEYMEDQFGLPNWLMEPLQIVVTILATNSIMLILDKLDLFDVQYGLLTSNIDQVFEEEYQTYIHESEALKQQSRLEMEALMENMKSQISELEQTIQALDPYRDDVLVPLERMNRIYDMNINFEKEWNDFITIVPRRGESKCCTSF